MGRTLTGFALGGGMPMPDLDGYIRDNLGALLTPSAGRSTLDELGFYGGGGGEVSWGTR